MGELDKAAQMLDAVALTTAPGQPSPDDLVSKQRDLEQTKQLIAQVCPQQSAASVLDSFIAAFFSQLC